jgi:hypothetical protein
VRRREFIKLIGNSALVWPLAARAEMLKDDELIGVITTMRQHKVI